MLKHLVNLAKGEVTGRVESGFPERVLNLCAEFGVVFWDLTWESPVAFTFTMTRRDWKRLRRLSKRIDCDMTPVDWKGTPFFLGRIRYRYGLWITLALCAAALFTGSFYIWDFEVEGNETVSQQEILRALDKFGVGFGTFSLSVDSSELRDYMLLEVPELSYIAVNVKGCRAHVQVRERVPEPEIISNRDLGNTVAAKDALITSVQVWDGEKMVLPGTTVTKGQLLISGVVQDSVSGVRYLRGMGKIYGRTWYHLVCRAPLTVREKVYTGAQKTRRALLIGKKRVNLYFGSSISGDTYDKIINWKQWELPGGVVLPVTVSTETVLPYELTERQRGQAEAQAIAEAVLDERLAEYLDEGEVLRREITSEVVDGNLVVTLSAECEEQIGRFVDTPR